ncbi:twin-arginine leader-binding protein for DmsA and TorA [Vibrio alfacsensis]|uniref:TorD/DmsD family molecular chaperone n=1 Tax=Vibrio alfacsensis TaxID=1074311 RepID=UPI001BF013A4|nr:molecular chaperone TorD family protein [Vibrio alfacsensis]BBM67233.1 twin-arginine leader-binding protein for DmsA and TorA [Vibrio alfacsensis]
MQNEITLFRLLGGLCYYSPNSESGQQILSAFATQDDELLTNLSTLAQSIESDTLEADYFNLLQGSGDMPCPPWGSVYLDRENALFGSSTIEYREFTRQLGMECDTGLREPEDHIGLMLMLVSLLLEQDNVEQAKQLISQHLMPFAPIMLESMQQHAETEFYRQLAAFVLAWLNFYCKEHQLQIVARRNYWQETE